jgi:hypothetical protein
VALEASAASGLIGPRGEPAPSITGWRVDPAAYAAVPLLSDGSEGTPLEFAWLVQAISRQGVAARLMSGGNFIGLFEWTRQDVLSVNPSELSYKGLSMRLLAASGRFL